MTTSQPEKNLRHQHRQKVIVIIDDDNDLRAMLAEALADSGALIIEAETAEKGVAASEMYVVDVILVDVFMPGKGGIWVVGELKRRHPNAVIISMSGGWKGLAPESAIKAAKKTGAHFGYAKPFDIWELHDLVGDILKEEESVIGDLNLAMIPTATAAITPEAGT